MDKLEKAKQAAIDKAFKHWGYIPGAYGYMFDAGVAYQGEWTAVEDGLPEESKYYIVAYEDLINYDETDPTTMFFHQCVGGWNSNPEVKKVIAWREIPKYQPDGGEGE